MAVAFCAVDSTKAQESEAQPDLEGSYFEGDEAPTLQEYMDEAEMEPRDLKRSYRSYSSKSYSSKKNYYSSYYKPKNTYSYTSYSSYSYKKKKNKSALDDLISELSSAISDISDDDNYNYSTRYTYVKQYSNYHYYYNYYSYARNSNKFLYCDEASVPIENKCYYIDLEKPFGAQCEDGGVSREGQCYYPPCSDGLIKGGFCVRFIT